MANIKRANASSITKSGVAIADVPDAPTIGAVADTTAGGTVTVAYTAAATGGTATTFTATSSPGGITGTGASPITVTGLTDDTAYTFTVTATNSTGANTSSASSSVTPTSWLTGAYDSIATTTVGAGGAASITFSSIPQTYTHLQIRGIAKWTTTGNDQSTIQFILNSDTGSNYAYHAIRSNGSSAIAVGQASYTRYLSYLGAPSSFSSYANMFGATVFDLHDYTDTNKYKTMRSLVGFNTNGGSDSAGLSSGLWMSTTAVTSITVALDGNLAQYSSFALYGIKGA
jgi:hypothetical protein